MKYRYVRITFQEKLTADQEETLLLNLDSLRDETAKKLHVALSEMEHGWAFKGARMLPMNAGTIALFQSAISSLLLNLMRYIHSEKTGEREYTFFYARDELALVKLKQHRYLCPIRETLVTDGLKRFVFPDMKVEPSKVLLERGDTEKDIKQ